MTDGMVPGPASGQAVARPKSQAAAKLTRQQKAAIVIGAMGAEAAGPLLEELDEGSLRGFAAGMSKLKRVEPEMVEAVIAEFLGEIEKAETTVRGGLGAARGVLEQHLDERTLVRILDDVDIPSIRNVWKKLARVNEDALAEFLRREHPQTVAVVLSKLTSDLAARMLGRFTPDQARDIVIGITKAQSLDPKVIEAIGVSVSRDFLSAHQTDGPKRNPAESVGAIMNFTSPEIRNHVLDSIGETQPEFAEEVKRKMFTFEDIPKRVGPRDVPAVVRAVETEILLQALAGAETTAPEAREHLLTNISTRVAEQLRGDLKEMDKVRRKDAETAQNEVILAIRNLVERGEMVLLNPDDDG